MSLHVLHFTVVRELTPGQMSQLQHERRAAADLAGTTWETIAYQARPGDASFVRRLPLPFRIIFLRKLFAWLWLLRHARQYDYVICRHMTFDPFALLFAWWIPNRVTVHHGKEIEELKLVRSGWKGRAASGLERLTGRVATRRAVALLAVTDEIRRYELALHGLPRGFPSEIFPNGICVDEVQPLSDERCDGRVELAFICGTFSDWHGLDVLLEQFESPSSHESWREPVTLHLIGRLDDRQWTRIRRIQERGGRHGVEGHGSMTVDQYRLVLARCHVGLGSFGLDRKGLTEAATLKVREMLAMGLPVYAGHRDAALPPESPFFECGDGAIADIIDFARRHRGSSRRIVREGARPYIEKYRWMDAVADFLKETVR